MPQQLVLLPESLAGLGAVGLVWLFRFYAWFWAGLAEGSEGGQATNLWWVLESIIALLAGGAALAATNQGLHSLDLSDLERNQLQMMGINPHFLTPGCLAAALLAVGTILGLCGRYLPISVNRLLERKPECVDAAGKVRTHYVELKSSHVRNGRKLPENCAVQARFGRKSVKPTKAVGATIHALVHEGRQCKIMIEFKNKTAEKSLTVHVYARVRIWIPV